MDTNKLKRFATEARNKILKGVKEKLRKLGFNEKGEAEYFPQQVQGATLYRGQQLEESFYDKWIALHEAISKHGLRAVYEEVAYTWFNRLVAIRILQKNGFIDRVLLFDNPDIRVPHIVSEARQGRYPAMDTHERLRLLNIISDPTRTYEQFVLLLTTFCKTTPMLNQCFGGINDYTELLLPDDILDEGGFIDMLNHTEFISDEDYRTTELLGWLYQFYISERKDEVFAKKGKFDTDEIPAATQIFTPNWIVKYMVENTLGRIYLDNNSDSELAERMPYLVDKADNNHENIYTYTQLEDLKVIDPACGSGHILLEAFDLLYDMYLSEFYSREEAITNIFRYNLVGIDIDTRAKQLATFALLLKACQKDNRFLSAEVMPRIMDMPDADRYTWRDLNGHFNCIYEIALNNEKAQEQLDEAFNLLGLARTLGSIMRFNISDTVRDYLFQAIAAYDATPQHTEQFEPLVQGFRVIVALTDRYAVVVANPPYMGSGNMNAELSNYIKINYEEGKADLFAVFMLKAEEILDECGKCGMINMQSWMFLSSFEKLRTHVINSMQIDTMLHLGPHTFDELSGEVVQNTAFVLTKHIPYTYGIYYRLINGKDCGEKEQMFLNLKHCYFYISQQNFEKIPGCPIGYWVSEKEFNLIKQFQSIGSISEPRAGLQTSDNNRFLRLWFEVAYKRIGLGLTREAALISNYKWFPHNKGGQDRRWFGNRDYIINFYHDGEELKYWLENNPNDPTTKSWSRNLRNYLLYFNEGLTWGAVTSKRLTVRYSPIGSLFDTSGPMLFSKHHLMYILGLMNSSVFIKFARIFAQGLSIGSGHIANVPFIYDSKPNIKEIVLHNITISQRDWDAHETSWDFEENELIRLQKEGLGEITATIEDSQVMSYHSLDLLMKEYKLYWEEKFRQLHANEEELNRQFIKIYGLEDELIPDVPFNEITILQAGEISIEDEKIVWHDDVIIKQLISYAIGCIMGRYSLDHKGLILANQGDGQEQYDAIVSNSRFEPDDDGILPLMDDNSPFNDNAARRMTEWIKIAFGADNQAENLNFIEAVLGKNQNLAGYLAKDFWKDHKKMYQNRPIYWLFSSKKGAFRVLVYMHRMDAFTVSKIRNKYLLPYIEWLKQRINDYMVHQAELSVIERRQLKNYTKQLEECQEYDIRLHEVANQQISIDLDDGVIVNYAKYGDILEKLK